MEIPVIQSGAVHILYYATCILMICIQNSNLESAELKIICYCLIYYINE